MKSDVAGRRILVTGGSAFTGKLLVEKLVALGAHVRVPSRQALPPEQGLVEQVQGDLRDAAFCARLTEGIDEVLHLASFRRNVAYHVSHREEILEANLSMTQSLLQALSQRDPVPVLFFSTAAIAAVSDEDLGAIPDGYIAGKLRSEREWTEASQERGFPLLIVRPASIYGPGDAFGPDGNVIPALITRCDKATDALTVWGDGKQVRPFVYVSDAVDAALHLRANGAQGVQYLCPPERVSIGELAVQVCDLLRPGLPLVFDTGKPQGPSFPSLPIAESLREYPWIPLQEGLRRTVDWYKRVR